MSPGSTMRAIARVEHLCDSVRGFAQTSGSSPAITFVEYTMRRDTGRRERTARTISYAELDEQVRALAATLQRRWEPGTRVAVLCPHEPSYVVAFLACLYAGVVAVPLYAPEALRSNERLLSVLADCDPRCVLTTSVVHSSVLRLVDQLDQKPGLVCVDEVSLDEADNWRRPAFAPGDVAYLQYTSGSTGNPSGVRITHENLSVANQQIWAHWPSSIVASWVPFFHDFGLVCAITSPLAAGAHSVNLSPMAFVQDPYRWLRMISDYRADWSITPSSSLAQCVRRVTEVQKRDLDLRSLRLLTIAAEPVYAEPTEAFAAAFAGCGLAATTPTPSYGLAEATLPVSAVPLGEGMTDTRFDRATLSAGAAIERSKDDVDALRIVSCGVPSLGVSVRITHRATDAALQERQVGEIWVSGPNVADGYWNQPERSADVFVKDPAGRWLRTGDLGFLHEGRLYVVGRAKDMIIIRGRNHYPDDIETTVQAARDAGPHGVAAFSTEIYGEDGLIILIEAEPALLSAAQQDRDAVLRSARQEVTHRHGLVAHDLILVRRGALPRTTSGKIRRGACREQYLRGEFGGTAAS